MSTYSESTSFSYRARANPRIQLGLYYRGPEDHLQSRHDNQIPFAAIALLRYLELTQLPTFSQKTNAPKLSTTVIGNPAETPRRRILHCRIRQFWKTIYPKLYLQHHLMKFTAKNIPKLKHPHIFYYLRKVV